MSVSVCSDSQLSDSPEPNKPGIKELLTELQTAIEAEINLPDDDKAEALEQVKALAEVRKNPQDSTMQKAGKTAIKILQGTIASYPSASMPEVKGLLLQLQAAIANENTELSIQSIENPEKRVIAIFVNTLKDEQPAITYHDLKQNYELLLKAIEDKYQAELRAKDCEIAMYRQEIAISQAVSESITKIETATNLSQEDESIAESEDVESLRAIAQKYKAELKYKDEEIALYRQQIAEMRELTETLAKQPIEINIIQEDK
jgi:hypothetical protein